MPILVRIGRVGHLLSLGSAVVPALYAGPTLRVSLGGRGQGAATLDPGRARFSSSKERS